MRSPARQRLGRALAEGNKCASPSFEPGASLERAEDSPGAGPCATCYGWEDLFSPRLF